MDHVVAMYRNHISFENHITDYFHMKKYFAFLKEVF